MSRQVVKRAYRYRFYPTPQQGLLTLQGGEKSTGEGDWFVRRHLMRWRTGAG